MKTLLFAMLASVSLPVASVAAGELLPGLLGVPTPAADVVPGAEATRLDAISEDGRWFLLTSTSDRFVTNDVNAAPDVFLFDRTTGRATLVSAGLDGAAGNGASLAPAMSPDARYVAFQSRASNLVEIDRNATWDVFVRDRVAGTNRLASVGTNGFSAAGASTAPRLSSDGRFVLFTSEAKDLVTLTEPVVWGLFRRDLAAGETLWASQQMTGLGAAPSRTLEAALSSDGQYAVFVARGVTNQVFRRDLGAGDTLRLSGAGGAEPEELGSASLVYGEPVLSGDGAFAACRFSWGNTNGIVWMEAAGSSERGIGLGTARLPVEVPSHLLGPSMSADGQSLAYVQPVPVSGGTDARLQVFHRVGNEATSALVSARLGTEEISNAHAVAPRITPDGRFVAFLSTATDLAPGTTGGAWRVYLWDSVTGVAALVADLGTSPMPDDMILSANGAWLGVVALGVSGAAVVHLVEIATGSVTAVPLEPVAVESASGRGWIDVRPEGVSADGRYVALTAFPSQAAGGTNHMQVQRLDTQTGLRQVLSEGVDGQLANRHSWGPALSADGGRVLFYSWALNLVAGDWNNLADVFVQDVASGQRAMIRGTRVSSSAIAFPDSYLCSDGAVGFVKFYESGKTVGRLVRLPSGAVAIPFSGAVRGAPSFSGTGQRVAVSRGASTSGSDARAEVHDTASWLAATGILPGALWTAPATSVEPALSATGTLVAYLSVNSTGTNAVVVTDWAANRRVFAQQLPTRVVPSGLRLSADGSQVTWLAPGSVASAVNQVWCGDVSAGTVTLASVASDGVSAGNGQSKFPGVSPDGRYVVFASLADNLVAGDSNGAKDVFLRDLVTARTLMVSRTPSGKPGAGWSLQPFFSADGQSLFFLSAAPDLSSGDYNQVMDLFKVEIIAGGGPLLTIRRNLSTGVAELLWAGLAGKRYRIEFKEDVGGAEWTAIPGEFAGDVPVPVDGGASPRRFFRVIEW